MKIAKSFPKVSVPERIEYPSIDPVPEGVHRPLWSVMITTYNRTEYLEQALKSVLEQDPGPDEMQIEVVDDCSPKEDIEAFVRKFGQDRVSFYRQPKNVGIYANWNTCINRAHGYWVHILHDDDLVLPGFYSRLREAIENESTIGAAFCRHIHIDEEGNQQFLSPLERETPGILSDWLERIAVMQLIQCPSIVVKRSIYEELGGFCLELSGSNDWEMWKRIAAYYPIWYAPQILACFRLHSASESSRLVRSGANIADARRAIEISKFYLPNTLTDKLSRKAREHCAVYALDTAYQMLAKGDTVAATAQIREALNCSYSFRVVARSLVHLIKYNILQKS